MASAPVDRPWYSILAATVLGLGFAGAAFWLLAFSNVETGTAFAFLSPALLIVGYITGQAVPSGVASVLSRASVAAPTEPADQQYMASRVAKRAEADAQLAAQAETPRPATVAAVPQVPRPTS